MVKFLAMRTRKAAEWYGDKERGTDMPEEVSIKEVQRAILNIFKVADEIFERHGLRYFAVYGTAIGAVRHKGFIPWDDDMDIAMPRPDYEAFRRIANEELPPRYRLIGYDYAEHYNIIFDKIQDTETTVIEKGLEAYTDRYTGVWLDIFPLDGMPVNRWERFRWIRKLRHLQGYNDKRRFGEARERTGLRRLRWELLKPHVMPKPFDFYARKYDECLKSYPYDEAEFTSFASFPRGYKHVFPTKYFEDFQVVPFEDYHIRIPAGNDAILKTVYGDYMRLPPPEERRQHLNFVDLKRSYLYYRNYPPRI